MAQILFVYNRASTFVAIDRDILARRWQLREWVQSRPLVNLPRLVAAVWRSDLVFGWFASWHTFLPVAIAWLLRRPSVVVVGGYDSASIADIDYGLQRRPLFGRISRWVMRHATRLIANSHFSRGELEANAGIPAKRIDVVYHGVPDPFGELPAGSRERLALTVGVVDRRNLARKGLRPFVEAAARLPDVSFVLAGKAVDDAGGELSAVAGENVTLAGFVAQDELEDLYRRAAVYVQASRHEGFGLSVAEAMLAGCIPVVTGAGALPEVVGDAGVTIDEPEPASIAKGIERALTLGPEARERARARVLERFPMSAREDGLVRVVEEALRTRGG